MNNKIITGFENKDGFINLLKRDHPGLLIQFTASWCGPCKRIKPTVDKFMQENCNKIICCKIDVDNNMEVYSHMKRFKMLRGVPAFLYYDKNNHDIYPTKSISGGDNTLVKNFFSEIIKSI